MYTVIIITIIVIFVVGFSKHTSDSCALRVSIRQYTGQVVNSTHTHTYIAPLVRVPRYYTMHCVQFIFYDTCRLNL